MFEGLNHLPRGKSIAITGDEEDNDDAFPHHPV